jgi:hypothetical protein
MLRAYTGADRGYAGAPELARAALKDELTPDQMRDVASQYLPEKIVGFGTRSDASGRATPSNRGSEHDT